MSTHLNLISITKAFTDQYDCYGTTPQFLSISDYYRTNRGVVLQMLLKKKADNNPPAAKKWKAVC